MKDEKLLTQLSEDVGANEAEALLPVAKRLQAWSAPQPTASERAKLLATLQPALPLRPSLIASLQSAWIVLLLRAQLRVVRAEIWSASAVVMLLGLLVTLAMRAPSASGTLPFVLVAPLAAAIGVAFIYGPSIDPALEIELTLPVSPRVVLLLRLALVFGFDLGLGLLGSVALTVFRADLSLWPLVQAWLAPMTFLSALALLLTTVKMDTLVSLSVCLTLWGYQTMRSIAWPTSPSGIFAQLPDLLAADARLWLFGLALIFGLVGVWLAGREERWVRGLTTV